MCVWKGGGGICTVLRKSPTQCLMYLHKRLYDLWKPNKLLTLDH